MHAPNLLVVLLPLVQGLLGRTLVVEAGEGDVDKGPAPLTEEGGTRAISLEELPSEMIAEVAKHLDLKSFLLFSSCASSMAKRIYLEESEIIRRLGEYDDELKKYDPKNFRNFTILKSILSSMKGCMVELLCRNVKDFADKCASVDSIVRFLEALSTNYEQWTFPPYLLYILLTSPSFVDIASRLSDEYFRNLALSYWHSFLLSNPEHSEKTKGIIAALKRQIPPNLKTAMLSAACLAYGSPQLVEHFCAGTLSPSDAAKSVLHENVEMIRFFLHRPDDPQSYARVTFLATVSYGKCNVLVMFFALFKERLQEEWAAFDGLPSTITEEYKTSLVKCVRRLNHKVIDEIASLEHIALLRILLKYKDDMLTAVANNIDVVGILETRFLHMTELALLDGQSTSETSSSPPSLTLQQQP